MDGQVGEGGQLDLAVDGCVQRREGLEDSQAPGRRGRCGVSIACLEGHSMVTCVAVAALPKPKWANSSGRTTPPADLAELGDTATADDGGDPDFGADAVPVGLGAAQVDFEPVVGLAEFGQVFAVVVAVKEIALDRVVGYEEIEVTVAVVVAPGGLVAVAAVTRDAAGQDFLESTVASIVEQSIPFPFRAGAEEVEVTVVVEVADGGDGTEIGGQVHRRQVRFGKVALPVIEEDGVVRGVCACPARDHVEVAVVVEIGPGMTPVVAAFAPEWALGERFELAVAQVAEESAELSGTALDTRESPDHRPCRSRSRRWIPRWYFRGPGRSRYRPRTGRCRRCGGGNWGRADRHRRPS